MNSTSDADDRREASYRSGTSLVLRFLNVAGVMLLFVMTVFWRDDRREYMEPPTAIDEWLLRIASTLIVLLIVLAIAFRHSDFPPHASYLALGITLAGLWYALLPAVQ